VTARWRRIDRDEIDHELVWSLTVTAGAAGAAALLLTFGLPPIACQFKSISGLPCLTCGATRSLLALLHGGWRESLALHPLVVPGTMLGALFVPYGLAVSLLERPRLRVELDARDWKVLRAGVALGAAGVWSYLIAVG
jgi:hypothetical protein